MHEMEYYSALSKKEISSHATAHINLEDMMLSELSQYDSTDRRHIK